MLDLTERPGVGRRATGADLARPSARAALVAGVLGTALAYMSDDMLNLAIPSVARDLRATVTDVQWILNAYYLSLVSFVLVAGSIGDIVGHRRVFLAGIGGLSLGGLLCAVAPTVPPLVIGRFIQGGGAAMLLASALALVTRSTSLDSRGQAVGRFLALVAAVPALGPFLSGALVDALSWRWLFIVPLVLPLIGAVVAALFVADTPRMSERRPDVIGATLIFVALASFSVALIAGPADLGQAVPLLALGVAGLAAVAFFVAEGRAAEPMLPMAFFRRRRFVGGNLIWLLACLTSWGAVFFVAVTLQATLGLRPIVAGLALTPIYLVMMLGAPLAGRLADRVGPRSPIVLGLAIYTLGLVLLAGLGVRSELIPDVMGAILVFALGMATFTAPLAALTMSALDERDQGVASGMNNAMGQLAGLLAIAILPAAAGLTGVSFGDPQFAVGYLRAMVVVALIAAACIPIAVVTTRTARLAA